MPNAIQTASQRSGPAATVGSRPAKRPTRVLRAQVPERSARSSRHGTFGSGPRPTRMGREAIASRPIKIFPRIQRITLMNVPTTISDVHYQPHQRRRTTPRTNCTTRTTAQVPDANRPPVIPTRGGRHDDSSGTVPPIPTPTTPDDCLIVLGVVLLFISGPIWRGIDPVAAAGIFAVAPYVVERIVNHRGSSTPPSRPPTRGPTSSTPPAGSRPPSSPTGPTARP